MGTTTPPTRGLHTVMGSTGQRKKRKVGQGIIIIKTMIIMMIKIRITIIRWIRASQAKKISGRIFTWDLHQGGRRAGQVRVFSI